MSELGKHAVSPQKMLKQAQKTKGYLMKRASSIFGGWDQRYFIILNGALAYYADEALQKQKGDIKIKDINAIIMKDTDHFLLQTPKRQYQFKCQNQQDRDLWVASLNLLKQYVSNDDFTKKFHIKKVQVQTKNEHFQLCKIEVIRQVLHTMKLNLLVQQLDESRIHQRIYCQQIQDGFYIAVSIKCLEFTELDQQILSQKYILPYNFNKLYKVYNDGKVQDIAKMSQMQSLKSQDGSIVLTFSDKKKLLIPYKIQAQAYQISKKLCRCYEVAKQYYNSFKIVLKKNIDKQVHLYDHFKQIFQQQTAQRVDDRLGRFLTNNEDPVSIFLQEFLFIKKDLIDTEQACKVMNPPKQDLKCAYFRMTHEKVRKWLTQVWQNLFSTFQLKNLLVFSNELYQYWIVINPVVGDSSIIDGCIDLNKFFISRAGDSIKQKIHQFNAQKVQYIKIKSQPVGNQLTTVFFQWIKQINSCCQQMIPIEAVFDQFCKFYDKCFDEFLEYLNNVSEKWSQILVIIGACNDLIRIKKFFKNNTGSQLCKGIFAQKKFYTNCGNQVLKKITQSLGNLIKKAFIIFFRNIDKKLLIKPFLQIDFSKICYQVLQRMQPYKSKLLEQVQYQMVILSFDQICYFLYTIYMNKNVPAIKNVKQHYIKAVEKGLIQIQQFYCNIKTQCYVKKYLKQVNVLSEILSCPEHVMTKHATQLYQTFGSGFNQQNIITILHIRQTAQDNLKKVYQICLKGLKKSPSSQDSESIPDSHIRSRKSTITQSLYTIQMPDPVFSNSKPTKQGYLQMKKMVKGISNFFNRSYFKVKDGHLLQYCSPNSTQIISSIQLDCIDHCYLDAQGTDKGTFIIVQESTFYYFKSSTRDQAGLWIQAIHSQIKHPLFQNKSHYTQKDKKNALFKNFQLQLTTTTSQKLKPGENIDDDKFFDLKRKRRIRGIEQSKVQNNPSSKKISPKKHKQKSNKTKDDQGTCCTYKMF